MEPKYSKIYERHLSRVASRIYIYVLSGGGGLLRVTFIASGSLSMSYKFSESVFRLVQHYERGYMRHYHSD